MNDKNPVDSSIRVRNAVILPDGSRPVPLGSGTITGLLGSGGMANVYEIWNSQLEVGRAIKLMHPNLSEDSKRHFQTEMKIMAELTHPNIVEIHSVGKWNDLPFIELELVDGPAISQLVEQKGALPIPVCTAVAILVTRALYYAHSKEYVIYGNKYRGIIHRDLKPSNIMISKDGKVKLMDFGIARPIEASLLTTDDSVMGTIQYLSPEQLDGKGADVRSDIYSFGTVLYEMLTGVKAFPQINMSKLMMCKIKNDYRPIENYDLKVPPPLRKLVHKCLMHDKKKRIQDTGTLLADLEKIHKNLTLEQPEDIVKKYISMREGEKYVPRYRKRVPWGFVAAAVCLVVAGFGLAGYLQPFFSRPGSESPVPKPQEMREKEKTPSTQPPAAPPRRPGEQKTSRPEPKPEPEKHIPLIDKLKSAYGTGDPVEAFARDVEAGNYTRALKACADISPEIAQSKKALIYRIRALSALNRTSEKQRLISAHSVDDAEFYLEKARTAFRNGSVSQTMELLNKSMHSPARFMDSRAARTERLYYQALCQSKLFDRNRNGETKKSAMDSWFEVKSALRSSPEHKYYKQAVSEMQRIGKAYE
ncbi:MAG: protein kinase [Chitinivibrionales bacterium]|nr:protein kinase [Chitinivibrionales bacterium]